MRSLGRLVVGFVPALSLSLGAAHSSLAQDAQSDWFPGSSSVLEKEEFPKGFQGKWASSAKECADKNGIEAIWIYPNGIDFYESGARLERITQSGQDRTVLVSLSFEGEGGFWSAVWNMNLSADRRVLEVWEEGKADQRTTFRKCLRG